MQTFESIGAARAAASRFPNAFKAHVNVQGVHFDETFHDPEDLESFLRMSGFRSSIDEVSIFGDSP